MSPFTWFAVILTVGYIIYYTVMIMNDLYGKKPEEKNNTEEIDVPTVEGGIAIEETPIEVSESDDGFNVGDEEYEANLVPDDDSIEEETVENNEKAEEPKVLPGANLKDVTEGRSEEIQTQFDDEYGEDEFMASLLNGGKIKANRPPVELKPIVDEI